MDDSSIALIRELVLLQHGIADPSLCERREAYERAEVVFASEVSAGIEPVRAGMSPAEWLRPREDAGEIVVLYLHGGAYALGSPRSHRHLAAAIGQSVRAPTLVLDYRRAPEDRFPAALEDAVSAYRWLLDTGVNASRIVLAGDSAGGGLAVCLMISLRDKGFPPPAAGVCISPWADLTCTSKSHVSKAGCDPVLRTEDLRRMAALYLGGEDPRNPLASPVFANLERLPPLLVQVGTQEILLEDARELSRRAADAGVDVKLEEWREMIHVWHWYFPLLAEARAAIDAIGEFVRSRVSPGLKAAG